MADRYDPRKAFAEQLRRRQLEREAPLAPAFTPTSADSRSQFAALGRSYLARGGATFEEEEEEEQEPGLGERILQGPVGGALRGLASALEPLQLPQDALFAVVSGALDPDSTISERLGRMKLSDYLPGGDAPARPASGEEIFQLMGFDEGVAKWAGLGADLVVDPLIFGTFLRGVGKAARISELVTLGTNIDRMVSPVGIATGINRLARRSERLAAFQDARMAEVLEAFRNPDSTVFGIQRFGEKAAKVARYVVPEDRRLQLMFGKEAGAELFRAQRLGRQVGREVSEEGLIQLQRSMFGAAGDQNKSRFKLIIRSLEDQQAAHAARLGEARPIVRDVVEREVYDFAQQQRSGLGALWAMGDDAEVIAVPELRRLHEEGRAALSGLTPGTPGPDTAVVAEARTMFQQFSGEARERVMKVARDDAAAIGLTGDALEEMVLRAGRTFDDYLRDTLMIDARIGYHTSGYGFIADGVRGRMVELGASMDEANAAWLEVLRAGLLGGTAGVEGLMDASTGIRLATPSGVMNRAARRRLDRTQVRIAAVAAERARYEAIRDSGKVEAARIRESADLLRGNVRAQHEQFAGDVISQLGPVEASAHSTVLGGGQPVADAAAELASRAKQVVIDALSHSTAPMVRRGRLAAQRTEEAASAAKAAMVDSYRVSVPPRFYDEYVARGGPKGTVVSRNQAGVELQLTPQEFQRMRKDAPHYGQVETMRELRDAGMGADAIYFMNAARAASRRLDATKVIRPEGVTAKEAHALTSEASRAARAAERAAEKAKVTPPPSRDAVRGVQSVHAAARRLDEATINYLEAMERVRAGDLSHSAINRVIAGEERLEKALINLEERVAVAATHSGIHAAGGAVMQPVQHPAFVRLSDELNGVLGDTQALRSVLRADYIEPKLRAGEVLLAERRAAAQMIRESAERTSAATTRRTGSIDTEARRLVGEAHAERNRRLDEYAEQVRDQYGADSLMGAAHRKGVGDEALEAAKKADPQRYSYQPPVPAVAMDGRNTSLDDIYSARVFNLTGRDIDAEALKAALEAPVTFGELLGGIADFQALDLGAYLQGVMNGHLRKAYGLFVDGHTFDRYIDHLRNGRIVAANAIDEANFRNNPNFVGLDREVGMFEDYMAALSASGTNRIIRRDNVAAYLASQGVSGPQINKFLEAMHASASNTDAWRRHMQIIREQSVNYQNQLRAARTRAPQGAPHETPTVTNQRVFATREELTEEMVMALGEHARASMSVLESADYGRRVISRQEAFQNIYLSARDRGLIKNEPFTDQFNAQYIQLGTALDGMGGFGGKYMHPHLVKELQRLSQVSRRNVNPALQRLRSLITGGYLSSPAVLSANVIGGFYQAAAAGIGPATMMRRMAEVLPEMRAAARGEVTELTSELGKRLDVRLTTLVHNDRLDDFSRRVLQGAGLGPEGASGLFDKVTGYFEDFLQAPGIGRFKARWAGLEGFEFTENWFKVAAYKEMKERLTREGVANIRGSHLPRTQLTPEQVMDHAAEYARTVVFDYSTLPESLELGKRMGILMFPGFPYYLAGRTIGAALERPGVLAISDRFSEALMNAGLSAEEQILAYLGMDEWLREEQGSPLPFGLRSDPHGNKMVSMIPMAQLIPTSTVWDAPFGGGGGSNPWGESIAQLGLWGPIVDIITALSTGSGEAPISGRYGHKVFDAGAEGAEKASNIMRFLYNTMAPNVVKKAYRVDYGGRATGALPAIPAMLRGQDYPEDLVAGVYSIEERRTNRPEDTWREWVVSSFLRSPQTVALTGPLAGIRRQMDQERDALNDALNALGRRRDRARAYGQNAYERQLFERMSSLRNEHMSKWGEFTRFYREYQSRQRGEQGG